MEGTCGCEEEGRSVNEPQRVTVDAPSHSSSPSRLQGASPHCCRNPHVAGTAHRLLFSELQAGEEGMRQYQEGRGTGRQATGPGAPERGREDEVHGAMSEAAGRVASHIAATLASLHLSPESALKLSCFRSGQMSGKEGHSLTDSAQQTGTNANHRSYSELLSSAPYFQSILPYHPGDTQPLSPKWVHGGEGNGSVCDFIFFIYKMYMLFRGFLVAQ